MSHKRPEDPRRRRSRRLLREALVSLMAEKSLDEIAVGEIARRADVNRATFYRLYEDKQDLVLSVVEELFEELRVRTTPPSSAQAPSAEEVPAFWIAALRHIAERGDFYRAVLGKDGSGPLAGDLRAYLEGTMFERLHAIGYDAAGKAMPLDMVVKFLAAGYVGVLQWWLASQTPCAVEQLGAWIRRLTILGPYRALEAEAEVEDPA